MSQNWSLEFADQLKYVGLCPVYEFIFHPTRKWRFDCVPDIKIKLAVELEGGIWIGGRHNSPVGFLKDIEKYNEAAILGWRIIRVTGEHVKSGQGLKWVLEALKG